MAEGEDSEDLKELNFLHGVIHDDLAKILSDVTEQDGALSAEDFEDILPRLTVGLEPEEDMSKFLSANELRILGLVLAEYLNALKNNGLDIESASPGEYTKKQIVMHLRNIGQNQLALLLSKKRGIQNLQSVAYRNVYVSALKDSKGFIVELQVQKIILCGVPRSGKSTFWRRLVKDDFDTDQISQSTILAEHHYIHVSLLSTMLYDWHLCSEDGSNFSSDLDKEALVIYKKILEVYSSKSSIDESPLSAPIESAPTLKSSTITDPSELVKNEASVEQESDRSHIYQNIDAIFYKLKQNLTSRDDLPDISRVRHIFHLIDTGGQRAFLELLPVLTVGNALYLIFFSYGKPLNITLEDEYQGPKKKFNLDNEYTQIEVLLQSLRCVSTDNFADGALTAQQDTTSVAMLVGTHIDKPSAQPDINGKINDFIQTEVKGFLDSNTEVLEYVRPHELVLEVNNKSKDNEKFKMYREILMQVVDRKFSGSRKKLPGAWLMFNIILRKVKLGGWSVISVQHCEYVASKLFIPPAELKGLLHFMHNDLGILMYFPDVPCLRDTVICDPAVVFTSISEVIIKTFTEDILNKSKHGVRESLHFTEYAIFAYDKVNELTYKKRRALELNKLLILLQHIGIIAPIEFSKEDPEFKCTLDHDHDIDAVHCIQAEYIIPCVLKGTNFHEFKKIEQHCKENCTVAPLIITFECNFAPMGAFCYLFTKLITDQKANNWRTYLPDINSPNECPIDRIIRRNKVTFIVDKKFYVTLLSTARYFKVFILRRASDIQEGYEFICNEVWTAIKQALSSCSNAQVRRFKAAFRCDGHKKRKYEHNEHLMVIDSLGERISAVCEEDEGKVKLGDDHAVMVWFKGPFSLIKKPLCDMCEKFDVEVSLEVSTDPKFECNYKWTRKPRLRNDDQLCSGVDSNVLTIDEFCKEYEGIYTCMVTDRKNGNHRESVSAKLTMDAPEEFDIDMEDDEFYAYLSGKSVPLKDIRLLQDDGVVAGSFSEESIPDEVTRGGKRILKQLLKDHLKPNITSQPRSISLVSGEEAVFNITAEGTGTLAYQWQKDGKRVVDDHKTRGAVGSELTISNVEPNHAGNYQCIVNNDYGEKESETVRLSLKVTITEQPQNLCKQFSEKAVLQLSASGEEPIHYQWKKDGRRIYDGVYYLGTTTNQLTVKLTEEYQGDYWCIVKNDVNEEESQIVSLTIEQQQPSMYLPLLHELDRIDGGGRTVRLINTTAADWKRVATRLHFDNSDIRRIEKNNPNKCEDACRDMLDEWLRGSFRVPTNWETLIKALEEADFSNISNDLQHIIVSHQQCKV